MSQLSNQLFNKRVELGFSRKILAQKAGTGTAIIARIERGTINPSIKLLQRIARVMDTKFTLIFQ